MKDPTKRRKTRRSKCLGPTCPKCKNKMQLVTVFTTNKKVVGYGERRDIGGYGLFDDYRSEEITVEVKVPKKFLQCKKCLNIQRK